MRDIDEIIFAVRNLPKAKLQDLIQECILLASGIEPSEQLDFQDVAPLDVPLESSKDDKTGELRIRFPYALGSRNNLGWRELVVTPAAQRTLLSVLAHSVVEDEKEGRIQPTQAPLQ